MNLITLRKRPFAAISLFLYLCVTLGLYSWRVLLPAVASNRSVPVFYTAAHVQWHNPAQTLQLYNDAWLNEQMAHLGFTHPWDIYGPNPPSLLLFYLPLLAVPQAWLPFAWAGVNMLALTGGLMLLLAALAQPRRYALWLLPIVALAQPILHHIARGQLYLLVLLGLSLSFWGLARRHPAWGGIGLGLILVSKTAGGWILLLLLTRRRWRELGWAVGTAVPFILISLIWNGFAPWLAYFATLATQTDNPSRVVTAYQTIHSLFGHLFTFDPTWNPTPVFPLPWLTAALTLLTFAGTLYLSWRCGRLEDDAPSDVQLLTLAMWFALAVSNAPLAEDYHYVLLLPSLATAVWWSAKTGRGRPLLLLILLLLALPLPFKHPLLAQSWLALLAYPRVYGAYLLWGWLLWQLHQHSQGVQVI